MSGLKGFGNSRSTTIRGGSIAGQAPVVSIATTTLTPTILEALGVAAFNYVITDDASDEFARVLGQSRVNNASADFKGAMLVAPPSQWSVFSTPAAATQATASRAAVASSANICNSISARLIIPPGVNQPVIALNLRDGATGAGTILWSHTFGVGAAVANGLVQDMLISGLAIPGSNNTAMTLEFSAAGAATTLQSVAMTGNRTT